MKKTKRVCYHVPYDLTEVVSALADADSTPLSKWITEALREKVRQSRHKLLNPYPEYTHENGAKL
ncbi:MAG: hypothetical protein KME30_29045 [Iphinoe sp. HA4291-MV1]|jgi:hypothetical protein|nr:hypothetical protein [Iphinoe sp. HA4291-MV1]